MFTSFRPNGLPVPRSRLPGTLVRVVEPLPPVTPEETGNVTVPEDCVCVRMRSSSGFPESLETTVILVRTALRNIRIEQYNRPQYRIRILIEFCDSREPGNVLSQDTQYTTLRAK